MTPSVPRLLLSFLVAIAILPAVAQADSGLPQVPVPASDALTTTAHALAVAHWGVDPCAGQVTVTWAHMGAGINARSTWMSYDIHNPATYTQCSISYNLDVDWDWPKLCTVIEHELGHLAGHDHVNDPHDVMSPYYVYPTPECAAGATAPVAAPAPATTAQAPAVAARGEQGHGGEEEGQAQGVQAQGIDPQRQGQGPLGPLRPRQEVRCQEVRRQEVRRQEVRRRLAAARAASADSAGQPRLFGCAFASA